MPTDTHTNSLNSRDARDKNVLRLNVRGDVIARLHEELRTLGFEVDDEAELFSRDTFRAVQGLQRRHGLPATGEVDAATANLIAREVGRLDERERLVLGDVLTAEGEPVAGAELRLLATTARGERVIARGRSGADGGFQLGYQEPVRSLAVRVVDEQDEPLAEEQITDPEPTHAVTLAIGGPFRGRPVFDVLAHRVRAALQAEDVPDPSSLTDEEISFVAAKHTLDPQVLGRFAASARLANETGVSQDAIFALLAAGQPSELTALLAQDPAAQRAALQLAAEGGTVSQSVAGDAEQVVVRLRERAIQVALAPATVDGVFSLGDLLSRATSLPGPQVEEFGRRYLQHSGEMTALWDELRDDDDFGEERVAELAHTLQLAALTWNHVPLVNALRDDGRVRSARDLARLTEEDWRVLIDSGGQAGRVGAPPGIPGADAAERRGNYARAMSDTVEAVFPTEVFAARLRDDLDTPQPDRAGLVRFFDNVDRFELGFSFENREVERFLDENSAALDGVEDPAALTASLKRVARLYPLAPGSGRYPGLRPLLADPTITSARSIVRHSEATFVRRHATGMGGPEQAHAVYQRALLRSGMAELLFTQFGPAWHRDNFRVLTRPEPLAEIPDWETLFGSVDLCQCQHCNSLLSPAAYLTDVLAFLRGEGLLDALAARRRDLIHIELSCANTNTTLPYVDLVNEILEQAVSGGQQRYQTVLDAETLRAVPEHVDHQAYEDLAEAVYPWRLPFDLPHEQATAYLEQLGVPRHAIMAAVRGEADPDGASRDTREAGERLGLSPPTQAIITGARTLPTSAFWGLNDDPEWFVPLRDEASSFLRQSGLELSAAQELFTSRFVNPHGIVEFEFEGVSCDLNDAGVAGLTEPVAGRMHRFVRLARAIGWSVHDLDRVITALAPDDLDDDFLIALSHVVDLRQRFGLPFAEMSSWWGLIDTVDYEPPEAAASPSQYRQLFLDETLFDEDTRAVFLDVLNDRDVGTVRDHASALAAVLRVDAGDFALLRRDTAPRLSLETITVLYRRVSLARALGVTVRDVLILQGLVNLDPFASPEATVRFVAGADKIAERGFTLAELGYLLTFGQRPFASMALPDATVALAFTELREGLQTIRAQTELPVDLRGALDALTERLGLLLSSEDVSVALAIVHGESVLAEAAQAAFLASRFESFVEDPAAIQTELEGLDPAEQLHARVAAVLVPVSAFLRREQSRGLVVHHVADMLGLPSRTTAVVLTDLLHALNDPARPAQAHFLADEFVTSQGEVHAAAFPDLFAIWTRVHKAGLLIGRMRIAPEELTWLIRHGDGLGLLDWNALPVADAEVFPALYPGWERLADLLALRPTVVSPDASLFALLEQPLAFDPAGDLSAEGARDRFLADLAAATGWDGPALQFLAGDDGFALAYPVDFRNGAAIRKMARCGALAGSLGVSEATLFEWTSPGVTPQQAEDMKAALKAKYDRGQWLRIAQGINDVLREERRDALVALLIARNSTFQDANDLFARLLIDPEMSSCMLTSRIKQAISSAQLFVQRVLFGLEGDEVTLAPAAGARWRASMKHYRVWEASRLIFVYPENWLEPDLRDDKTPLFRELENDLLQGELSASQLRGVLGRYLTGLQTVANLDMVGVHTEYGSGARPTHVFARTRSAPHTYYYRRWDFPARWTAWERMDVDVGDGEHLLPVVVSGQLFLFWLAFSERAEEGDPPAEGESERPEKSVEVKLAWSEYKDGAWQAKKESTDSLTLPASLPDDLGQIRSFVHMAHISVVSPIVLELFLTKPGATSELGAGSGDPITIGVGRFEVDATREVKATDFSGLVVEVPGATGSRVAHRFTGGSHLRLQGRDALQLTLPSTPGDWIVVPPTLFGDWSRTLMFSDDDIVDGKVFAVRPFDVAGSSGSSGGPGPIQPEFTNLPNPTHAADPLSLRPGAVGRLFPLLSLTVDGSGQNGLVGPTSARIVATNQVPIFSQTYSRRFRFYNHYHPYVERFVAELNTAGVEALLGNLELQQTAAPDSFFVDRYGDEGPGDPLPLTVLPSYPLEEVAFGHAEAYGQYNWELFFHIPLLIAERLSQQQRFDEADAWYRRIFDPTDCSVGETPQCYWKFLPFHEYELAATGNKPIQQLLELLGKGNSELTAEVAAWRADPFKPHAVARQRSIAYQKNVVMKYLDNLFAWADALFQRDSIESINEAAQLYVLAAEILGPRPTTVSPTHQVPTHTYAMLEEEGLDSFSNALIEIEGRLSTSVGSFQPAPIISGSVGSSASAPSPIGATLYFCVPKNDKLLGYWDRVADRLFKIRHCLNIEGVARTLPLFEPPIDPALLVRAAAAGLDLDSVLNDLSAPPPQHRFQVLVRQALEFASDVRNLGAALQSALEKRDGEELALLRSTHEMALLQAMADVRKQHIDETRLTKEGLGRARDLSEHRRDHYQALVREGLSKEEEDHLRLLAEAMSKDEDAFDNQSAVPFALQFPDISIGTAGYGGSPTFSTQLGGGTVARLAETFSAIARSAAGIKDRKANIAATAAGNRRRNEEWSLQRNLADREIKQIDKQIEAARIREAIATGELNTHEVQTAQAQAADELMRAKYSNRELYNWMISQISTVYFQSYQLAFEMAKRAEKALQHELGVTDTAFIQFGYWDSLRKGLLSGERLQLALRRMEAAYLEQHKREYELTKHVSLALLDPIALLRLRETGQCSVSLPEEIFDLDHPGHYMRRIKTAGLTVACVAGPYTTVGATLTLHSARIRTSSVVQGSYADDENYVTTVGIMQSVATSGQQSDSGLFESNLRDERLLPFEGFGAVSNWHLELPDEFRQFDYDTISDVILHLRYTARSGGAALGQAAIEAFQEGALNTLPLGQNGEHSGLFRFFSLRRDFSAEWHRFLHVADGAAHSVVLDLSRGRFPYLVQSLASIEVTAAQLYLKPRADGVGDLETVSLNLRRMGDAAVTVADVQFAVAGSPIPGVPHARREDWPADGLGGWVLESAAHPALNPDTLEDLWIVLEYRVSA